MAQYTTVPSGTLSLESGLHLSTERAGGERLGKSASFFPFRSTAWLGQARDSLRVLDPCYLCTHCPNALHLCPDHERCDDCSAQTKKPDQREAPEGQEHATDGGPVNAPS